MKHLFLYNFAVLLLQVVSIVACKDPELNCQGTLLHAGALDETVSSVPTLIGAGMACRYVALSGQHVYGFASAG
jgi:hypothetical protein